LITQRVGPLVELPGLLRDLDVDVDAVFEGSGVSPGSLSPDLRLPFPDLLDLFERAARISGFPHIGLLLGLRFDLTSHHGLIGALMQTAPTLKQALVDFATWQPGYSSGAIVYLNRLGEEYELGHGTYAVSAPGTRVLYDLVVGVGSCMVRQLTGGSVGPIEAHFTHGAEEDGAIYGRLLRMPARFNQPRTGVILQAAAMGTAPPGADPLERQRLLKIIEDAAWTTRPDFATKVSRAIRHHRPLYRMLQMRDDGCRGWANGRTLRTSDRGQIGRRSAFGRIGTAVAAGHAASPMLPASISRARPFEAVHAEPDVEPAVPMSTRSTSSATIRACSAGKSSSHSGSSCCRAARTSASEMSPHARALPSTSPPRSRAGGTRRGAGR
jgi:hypothetical protein